MNSDYIGPDPKWIKTSRRDGRILMAIFAGFMLLVVLVLLLLVFIGANARGDIVTSQVRSFFVVMGLICIAGPVALELFILLDNAYLYFFSRETYYRLKS
ncbi:MAG: hypothetical protein M3Q64_02315 [bacterium]|nr:hypothetical protein [bacterium]